MDQLKVKARSLAEEARIIRGYERRLRRKWRDEGVERTEEQRGDLHRRYETLREHRVVAIRREARATNLAIAFSRGLSYRAVERDAKSKPDASIVTRLVARYGRGDAGDILKWLGEEPAAA